jgi:arylsulfatase A-like enzyme
MLKNTYYESITKFYKTCFARDTLISIFLLSESTRGNSFLKPNIILVMSDDQGWGQVGYYDHPILETPHLNAMAENGIRFDRFYAGAPVCSPTRASVLTGRSNDRTAVYTHGYPMRLQEKTIAEALKAEGYQTAHFGKWHLNGLRGPGVPILKSDLRNPGEFGFDKWISVTNFFDVDPLMSDEGEIKEYRGSSSDIIVRQALEFISEHREDPYFVVIWYGSPHDPWTALERDKKDLPQELDEKHRNYLGEIVEIDNSIGLLRMELKEMNLSENTMIWFNSDNGGLREGGKEGVGGLRDYKGSVYEGGLRVPCIIEWPNYIDGGQIRLYPASTMDIFPTIAEILGLPPQVMTKPVDGSSIFHVFNDNSMTRGKLIPFKYENAGALIDKKYKLVAVNIREKEYELYDLDQDPSESNNILSIQSEKGKDMIQYYESWLESVESSIAGEDYEEGLIAPDPDPVFWWDDPAYEIFIDQWKDRPEYHFRLERAGKISKVN